MMTIAKVAELAKRLRGSLDFTQESGEEMLHYAAIQLSMAEWEELKVQPGCFRHLRPDGVIVFHGIQITARVRFEVKA